MPNFIGLYGGGVSVLPGHNGAGAGALVSSLVRSADVWLMAGVHLTDYNSAGHAMHAPPTARLIEVFPRYVRVGGQTYHRVMMRDFLLQLASPQLTHNPVIVEEFNKRLLDVDSQKAAPEPGMRSAVEQKESERSKKYPLNIEPSAQLTMRTVHHHLQKWITTSNTHTSTTTAIDTASTTTTAHPTLTHPGTPPAPAHVLVDCGDSWFTGLKLRLPAHGSWAVQLQYGSLGWGIPATLGYSMGLTDSGREGRLVALVGDGAFQMSPQELSTLLRYGQKPVVLVMNNSTYLVENEIVEGDYNDLVEWDYVGLAEAMRGRGGRPKKLAEGEERAVEVDSRLLAIRARTAGELEAALNQASTFDGLGQSAADTNSAESGEPNCADTHSSSLASCSAVCAVCVCVSVYRGSAQQGRLQRPTDGVGSQSASIGQQAASSVTPTQQRYDGVKSGQQEQELSRLSDVKGR